MDRAALEALLDACLLDDAEMAAGPSTGLQADPFPAWDDTFDGLDGDDGDDDCGHDPDRCDCGHAR